MQLSEVTGKLKAKIGGEEVRNRHFFAFLISPCSSKISVLMEQKTHDSTRCVFVDGDEDNVGPRLAPCSVP